MLQWIEQQLSIKKAVVLTGLLLGAAFLILATTPVLAQSIADPSSTLQTGVDIIQEPLGLSNTDIRVIIARIVRAAFGLVGIILVVLNLYAGFLWMTAGGNEDQIAKAKAILKNAVIGLAICLSAFAIVSFVINTLLGNNMIGAGQTTVNPPAGPVSFQGSGALGGIIKDHYPMRGETGVPRNAKIAVTFRKPIVLSDIAEDTNKDGVLGNCKTPFTDWRDCDRVKKVKQGDKDVLSDNMVNIKNTSTSLSIADAAIVAYSQVDMPGMPAGVYTIVIKPLTDLNAPNGGYLGSPTEDVGYKVRLGTNLRITGAVWQKAFQQGTIGNSYYEWSFVTSNLLDLDPPTVIDVFPAVGKPEPRNSVIQINFSEPVDPSAIQGQFSNTLKPYFLPNKNIWLNTLSTPLTSNAPQGQFVLTNGYRTLEFQSVLECGVNACGKTRFCLPSCGADCLRDDYTMLLKAARLISTSSFEATPFSGVMDMAGNALDGNADDQPDMATTSEPVFYNQLVKDNYDWTFQINNTVDNDSPRLITMSPGINATFVTGDFPWYMTFDKRMRFESLYNIDLSESPSPAARGDNIPLCRVPRIVSDGSITTSTMSHCPFVDAQQEYYPILTSDIEDIHYNCFYPGKGPGQSAAVGTKLSPACESSGNGCCPVTSTPGNAFCCNGSVSTAVTTTASCLNSIPAVE